MSRPAKFLVLALCVLLRNDSSLFASEPDYRATFSKGYQLYSQGRTTEAKPLFAQSNDAAFPLADYSLYYSAQIAFNEGDLERSRELLTQLRQRYPQSIWFFPAALQRAKIEKAAAQYDKAADSLSRLRAAKGVKADTAAEALYVLAQTEEARENAAQAHAYYRDVRDQYPLSRWAANARKDQARLRENFPDLFALQTVESIAAEAGRLTRERQFGDAETLYKKLLNNVTEPDLRLAFLAKLGSIYVTTRKRDEAIPVLNSIAREFPETPEASNSLYQIGQIFWNRHDNAQALEYFKMIVDRYPTSASVEKAQYAIADICESFGKTAEAVASYNKIITWYPNSPVRDDAIWRLAWVYYRAANWPEAFGAFKLLADRARDAGIATAGLYWQARSAEKSGDVESAKQSYIQIARTGEESYYQALAQKALDRLGVKLAEPAKTTAAVTASTAGDPPLSADASFHLSRARELSALSLNRMAVVELDEIARDNGDTHVRTLLIREYFRNQAYSRSLALANQLPTSNNERNLFRFPLAFWDLVRQYAQQRGLDPYLVLALIRQESLFDTRARSPAAALGLMQLLPSTATRVAKQIGVAPPAADQLFDPDVNLALGTQYFQDLLERSSNNWFKAIAAYNAGEAAVDRWQKELGTDDPEEFVERIPYVETRGYVKLVMRNHRVYKSLYGGQR